MTTLTDFSAPRFSIFLPVRNGGAHLHACIESIQNQRHDNFELIVLENQSTDGTTEWLQSLQANDSRVSVIPAARPLSVEENWQRILELPKNDYMTIIGHDDLFGKEFLSEMASLIKAHPQATLYTTHFQLIDGNGKMVRRCMPIPQRESAAGFLAARLARIRDSFGTGYVMRSLHYDALGGIPSYPDLMYADDALWMQLMRTSYKVTSPSSCFSYRLHAGSISGSPRQAALFNGLNRYLDVLREMATEDTDIALTLRHYAPPFVTRACRNYYFDLIRNSHYSKGVSPAEVAEIDRIMVEFTGRALNRTKAGKLQMIIWYWLVKWGRRLLPMIERALKKQ